MPDMDGKRTILNLVTKEYVDIECDDQGNSMEKLVTVGRYNFYEAVFERFNIILPEMLLKDPEWLVIDEAGKLELQGKGFFPAIKQIVEAVENKRSNTKLVLVVREGLSDEVISFFKINKYILVHRLESI